MQSSKKLNCPRQNKALKSEAIDFITIGVGCNCLVALFESGVLEKLIDNSGIAESEIEKLANPPCIKSALETLNKCNIVKKEGSDFFITDFGRVVAEYIGLISIFFDGYGNLVSQQGNLAKKGIEDPEQLIKGAVVSKAAAYISEKTIDPVIIKEIRSLNLSGTICDLGCGYGSMLSKICRETGHAGLGFDSEFQVVEELKEKHLGQEISVELADITNLAGIWEDVVILMQFHVFHDFTPESKCIKIMNSYLENFPKMKCFFYMDTVAPSTAKEELFPGFDYVHGLLGIPTRTYEETLQLFSRSNYDMIKEISISNLPNTFLWLLLPKRADE